VLARVHRIAPPEKADAPALFLSQGNSVVKKQKERVLKLPREAVPLRSIPTFLVWIGERENPPSRELIQIVLIRKTRIINVRRVLVSGFATEQIGR
jgi:hypothetical protein